MVSTDELVHRLAERIVDAIEGWDNMTQVRRTVYVVMQNDYPVKVFSSELRAKRMREANHAPSQGRYWHVKSVPLDDKLDEGEG